MAAMAESEKQKLGFVGGVAVVALTLVLAFQLAHWTWVFLAPQPVATTPDGDTGVDLAAIARLFGAAPPAAAAGPSSTGLKLKGVVAPDGGPIASAIFSTGGGKDIAVFVDREITPGVKLSEVKPDHVMISRGGVLERIDLEEPHATAGNSRGSARSCSTYISTSSERLSASRRSIRRITVLAL